MRIIPSVLFTLLCINLSAQHLPGFNPEAQPAPPDYSQERYWSALPFRTDAADVIPPTELWISDSLKDVDVFYIYPTIYKVGRTWNEDLDKKRLNGKIDRLPVRYQAGVFNASCQVYAPRYRQAILGSYYDSINGRQALDFAYQDVARAFRYYLDHYNHGRPIIIASHSQGSNHAWRLLREFFDGQPLSRQLVCAYIVGMTSSPNIYAQLKPCNGADETGCYVTWSSFKEGFDPGRSVLRNPACINPITWTHDSTLAPASASLGSIFLKIKHKKWEHAASARVHGDYLEVKTCLPIVRTWTVLHVLDYNLFWYDIRKNVADRVKAYLKK